MPAGSTEHHWTTRTLGAKQRRACSTGNEAFHSFVIGLCVFVCLFVCWDRCLKRLSRDSVCACLLWTSSRLVLRGAS
jgi:hypothetical protein